MIYTLSQMHTTLAWYGASIEFDQLYCAYVVHSPAIACFRTSMLTCVPVADVLCTTPHHTTPHRITTSQEARTQSVAPLVMRSFPVP